MLFYCCTNKAKRSHVSLKRTFDNCHILFRYLYSFVHAFLQCIDSITAQRACDTPCHIHVTAKCRSSTDFHATNSVDINWTVTVINKPRLPPKLLMTPRIPPPAKISPARIKLAASNFARWFMGVLCRESPISGNFASQEAQIRTNRPTATHPKVKFRVGRLTVIECLSSSRGVWT